MTPANLKDDLHYLRATVSRQAIALVFMGFALGGALIVMYAMVGRERIVITPPAIDKTFWITKDRVSAPYLEQMGSFIAYLTLDVSPESIEWKKQMLLHYVSPDVYGALQTQQDIEADRIRRLNATTQFSVAQLVPHEEDMSVLLKGRLATFINGQRTSDVEKAYLVTFEFKSNRVHLRTFKETHHAGLAASAASLTDPGTLNRE